jgi:PDDEXK-like domain of unknown function (DUF3799)
LLIIIFIISKFTFTSQIQTILVMDKEQSNGGVSRFSDASKFPFTLPYVSRPDAIPNEDYHNGEQFAAFISSTGLKEYKKSPLWFKYAVENNAGDISKEAQVVGSAYHDYLASIANCGTNKLFMDAYAIFEEPVNPSTQKPYGIGTGKYDEAENKARAEHPGKMLITKASLKTIKEMVNHLLYGSKENSSDIRMLLRHGKAERSYFCEYEGAYFKFRTDLSTARKIVDWKTVSVDDLHMDTIIKIINNFGYDISAAFYQFFNHIISGRWKEFYWVFQQKSPPYDFVIVNSAPFTYEFANETINGKRQKIVVETNVGARKFHALLDQHIHCVENNYWPGAAVFIPEGTFGVTKGKRIMECELPPYHKKEITFYN